jgi:hypothetical protein
VAEIEKEPESAITLSEMRESPYDYRLELADLVDDSVRVEFVLTARTANVNRLMREKGVAVLSIGEFGHYLRVSGEALAAGHPGLGVAGLARVLAFRYAGRELDLTPVSIRFVPPPPPEPEKEPDKEPEKEPEKEPCRSSSTSSDDAAAPEAAASSSTETSPSTPAEPASETPA